jgi:hypothetical protein
MDPVGRLLGFHKRENNSAPTTNNDKPLSWDVTPITAAQKGNGAGGYSIPDLQIANIADCPYIQFYTEDSYDAIARNIIRLR